MEREWFGEGDWLVRQKGLVREMGCAARRVREGKGLRGTWIGEGGWLEEGNWLRREKGLGREKACEGHGLGKMGWVREMCMRREMGCWKDGYLVEIGWGRGSVGEIDALGWRWVGEG